MATATATSEAKKVKREVKEASEGVGRRLQDSYKSLTRGTTSRTSGIAIRVNDFQKSTFERIMEGIGKLQDRAGENLHSMVKDSKLVPPEGVKFVEEWNSLIHKSRQDFVKSATKSYDLVGAYFQRMKDKAEEDSN